MAETEQQQSIFNLYDSFWFTKSILTNPFEPQQITTNPDEEIKKQEESIAEFEEIVQMSSMANLHVRSLSCDDFMNSISKISFDSDSDSPKSVLIPAPKLQTILSGKVSSSSTELEEFVDDQEAQTEHDKKMKQKKSKRNKSLSDLEFEELKGFMDLGFVFSEEDENDTNLICMIPGLQQKQSKKKVEKMISRPYLSEAWENEMMKMKKKNMLMNWKVPALNNEIDMKDHLKIWAHTVASTVR